MTTLEPKGPLSDAIERKEANAFNLLRLIAASAVIFGHSFVLSRDGRDWVDPVKVLTANYLSGTIAVAVFFVISGIFIAQSFDRDPSLLRFSLRRIARIWPGLIVCLLFSAMLGAVFSSVDWGTLWGQRAVFWRYVVNGARLQFDWYLPGAFPDRPNSSINGSLWSLTLEVRMYVILACLGVIGLAFRREAILPLMLFFVALGFATPEFVVAITPLVRHAFVPCIYFLVGMVIYAYREGVRVSWRQIGFALAIVVVSEGLLKEVALHAAIIASVVRFGMSPEAAKLQLPADYSYGVYLYGFPVQQVVATWMPGANPYVMTLLAIPTAFVLAVASWQLVEKPGIACGRELAVVAKADSKAGRFAIGLRIIAPILLLLVAGFVAIPR